MSIRKLLNNFTGGELSPQLDARTDLQKYGTGCRSLQNMRPLPWGGATFRAGTLFTAECKYSDRQTRLVPFNYSATVSYAIELGDLYMRFYRMVGPVANAAFFIRTSAYSTGSYVQWQGIVYRCINPVSSTIPPIYNNTPDVDTVSWVAQTSYELVQVTIASGDAMPWVNVSAYSPGQYVSWQGIVYVNILAVSAVLPPPYNNAPDVDTTHWTAQAVYELASPYTAAEVMQVQRKEINDVIYLVHPNHPVYKLTRTSAVTFTLAEFTPRYPALLDENSDQTTTLALSAISGTGVTMTSNVAQFSALHVGSYWELKHLAGSSSTQLDISGANITSSAVEVVGDWTLTTRETWYGTLQVQRSIDGGTSWQVLREFKSSSNHNVSVSGTELPPAAGKPRTKLRLDFVSGGSAFGTPPWVGTPPNTYVLASAFLELSDAYVAALVKVTAYTDTTHLVVTVVNSAASTAATKTWSEGAWSAYRGYPRAVGLYEQRTLFGGTTYKPNTIWGSVSGDFENFLYSDLDDAALAYQPATCQQNALQWIETLERAFAGTEGEEMALASGNDNEAMTPSNVTMRTQSGHGSAYIQPLVVGKAIIFVEGKGTRIIELMEGNPLIEKGGPDPIDLTLLAEHLGAPGFIQIDTGKTPDRQVYCVTADGKMAVMTYNKEQNVNAWAPWDTDGAFQSVAVLNGLPSDIVTVITQRVLPGGVKQYVEVFTAESTDPVMAIVGMDCSIYQEQTASRDVINLDPLEGMAVAVVADGFVVPDLSVSAGKVTLPVDMFPDGATQVRVGLAYFGQVKPMKIDMDLASGPTMGKMRRLTKLHVRFKDTMGASYGNATSEDLTANPQLYCVEIPFRTQEDNMDQPVPLFSGDKALPMEPGADVSADIVISQLKPLPMTVLGIVGQLDYFGE